jgi:F420H(2)-dependent quinone reductase
VDILLLDHVGRKSGQKRTSPLLYIEDGDDFVIVASKGGARKHPSWWINLRAHPRTTIQVKDRKIEVEANQAGRLDRRKLWPRVVEAWPDYAEYQKRTDREIPVIRLKPAAT